MSRPLGVGTPAAREWQLRWWWRSRLGNKDGDARSTLLFGKWMLVAPETRQAWRIFETLVHGFEYSGRKSFWTYKKRYVAGTTRWSLHSYPGIAGDMDPRQNPYKKTATWSDTKFSRSLVVALLALRTNNGKHVFAWGGQWKHSHDLMHWYIVCRPKDLETGIDLKTVAAVENREEETMRKGAKGKAVVLMQKALMAHGFALPKFGADGDFGGETLAAVEAFQVSLGLASTGIIGGVTASLLTTKSGTAGVRGSTGPTGPRGAPGVQGARGPTGPAANLSNYRLVKL